MWLSKTPTLILLAAVAFMIIFRSFKVSHLELAGFLKCALRSSFYCSQSHIWESMHYSVRKRFPLLQFLCTKNFAIVCSADYVVRNHAFVLWSVFLGVISELVQLLIRGDLLWIRQKNTLHNLILHSKSLQKFAKNPKISFKKFSKNSIVFKSIWIL